jgi:UDPglucose 6-dehydrogenase
MINIIGLGFVGLSTAVGLAFKGKKVNGVEIDKIKREKLINNIIPFYEPKLGQKLTKVQKNNKLSVSANFKISNSKNFFFICVGTPSKRDGSIELNIVYNVVKNIVNNIKKIKNKSQNYIVIKSTVIPGTIDFLKHKYKSIKNISFISNPEFLREGYAWEDFINPDKIVIGSGNKKDFNLIKNLYSGFDTKFVEISEKGAEFIKYFSNSALATMISFSNEMAMFAEKIKIKEVSKIFQSFHYDKRWSGNPSPMSKYFLPGLGYGGYCLPKDVRAFIKFSQNQKIKLPILQSTKKINEEIFNHQIKKISKKINKKSKIYLLGLSFKPNSDDLRDSKSLKFAKKLHEMKFKNLIFCDPACYKELKDEFSNITVQKTPTIEKKAIYILLTAWPQYLSFIKRNKNLNIINLRY